MIIVSIMLFPLLCLLMFLTYKEFKVIIGIKQLTKTTTINHHKYTKLDLKEIPVNYRIPRGQKAYLVVELKNTFKAQSQRMYTGHTKGGIRFPFFILYQHKENNSTNKENIFLMGLQK